MNGKLLTRVSGTELICQAMDLSANIALSDPTHDATDGGITLDNTVDNQGISQVPGCVPYVYAQASGIGTTPNSQVTNMTVRIKSGALFYNSKKATHNWLQAEGDAKAQQQDAAKKRTGPEL